MSGGSQHWTIIQPNEQKTYLKIKPRIKPGSNIFKLAGVRRILSQQNYSKFSTTAIQKSETNILLRYFCDKMLWKGYIFIYTVYIHSPHTHKTNHQEFCLQAFLAPCLLSGFCIYSISQKIIGIWMCWLKHHTTIYKKPHTMNKCISGWISQSWENKWLVICHVCPKAPQRPTMPCST